MSWKMESPIGTLLISTTPDGIRSIKALDKPIDRTVDIDLSEPDPFVNSALGAYFAGSLSGTSVLPVDLSGRGAFSTSVLNAIAEVPVGELITYGEIAARIGRPGAARAVGQMVGANPILIVIPCHRVVPTKKVLGGFSGGIWRKRWLLEHEGYAKVPHHASRLRAETP